MRPLTFKKTTLAILIASSLAACNSTQEPQLVLREQTQEAPTVLAGNTSDTRSLLGESEENYAAEEVIVTGTRIRSSTRIGELQSISRSVSDVLSFPPPLTIPKITMSLMTMVSNT